MNITRAISLCNKAFMHMPCKITYDDLIAQIKIDESMSYYPSKHKMHESLLMLDNVLSIFKWYLSIDEDDADDTFDVFVDALIESDETKTMCKEFFKHFASCEMIEYIAKEAD